MQISQATAEELGLLITGLRSIHVADQETTRFKLACQLENELSTRYSMMIGTADDQERNNMPAKNKPGRPRKNKVK